MNLFKFQSKTAAVASFEGSLLVLNEVSYEGIPLLMLLRPLRVMWWHLQPPSYTPHLARIQLILGIR